MSHLRVDFISDERAESERFNTQWRGVLLRNRGHPRDGTDDSDRFDFNMGSSLVEEMIFSQFGVN